MNHDYAHCLDYTERCPKECFRGELVRDLKEAPYPFPVSWMHLKDTEECIMNDLKPCPFCGDTYINIRRKEEGYNVGCNTVNCIACHVRTRVYKTEQEAIEAWNRRAGEQDE